MTLTTARYIVPTDNPYFLAQRIANEAQRRVKVTVTTQQHHAINVLHANSDTILIRTLLQHARLPCSSYVLRR